MDRYCYTDPLAAAWMAKKFGMKFDKLYDFAVLIKMHDMMRTSNDRVKNLKYYIHPDSLNLLVAREGDVCWEEGFGGDPGIGMPFALCDLTNHGPIIQRDGIAFMWPQVDNA